MRNLIVSYEIVRSSSGMPMSPIILLRMIIFRKGIWTCYWLCASISFKVNYYTILRMALQKITPKTTGNHPETSGSTPYFNEIRLRNTTISANFGA